MKDFRILIVDHHPLPERKALLEKYGYRVSVASSAAKGMELARIRQPDLIFTEVDLPDTDGIEFCRQIRKINTLNSTYFVFLSDRTDNYVQLMAFGSGADDYLPRSLGDRLLLARIQAYFRRLSLPASSRSEQEKGISPHVKIDYEKYLVLKDRQEIELPRKEFEIFSLLFKNPRRVFSRQEIKLEIWGQSDGVKSRTIDVHVKKLREKLGENLIKTVKGVGYKLEYE